MEKPKLRPIQAVPVQDRGRLLVQLFDPRGLTDKVAVVPEQTWQIIALFDGTRSLRDIQTELARRTHQLILSDQLQRLVDQLDQALLLDSERFRAHLRDLEAAYRSRPTRPAAGAGSGYPAEPEELARLLAGYFAAEYPDGIEPPQEAGTLTGLVAPHIDFQRGGPCYARAYAPLTHDACAAELFVVFGTAHHAERAPFVLTTKSFETPCGTLTTSAELVEEVARRAGGDRFAEELLHATEHSIEFQAILLRHVLGERPVEILPVLCGAFESLVPEGKSPRDVAEVNDFLEALGEVVEASGRRACGIAGADLSHVGRFFGDDFVLSAPLMEDVGRADRATLRHVERLDAEAFYDSIRADDNARHICGVPPIYALLATTRATRCELLDYRQAVDRKAQCAVTFASLALYA